MIIEHIDSAFVLVLILSHPVEHFVTDLQGPWAKSTKPSLYPV